MEQVIIHIKNKSKGLIDFLKTLDFIKLIENEKKTKSKVDYLSAIKSARGSLKGSSVTSEMFAQSKAEEKKLER
ncbi:MAG: hypothetical protein IIA88_08125 [Bacteroidetes bacterium]|nr:hypothetical protein [Bacteroidota bacterium]